MHPRIPVWLLCFMYPMCVSCTECGERNSLLNCTFEPTEEETDCNITISHKSATYLTIMFNKIDPDVAHFTLKFPENTTVNANEKVIQPFRWIWTFESEYRKVPFLQWTLDYATLSFGLLNAKALPETLVEFDVQPPNCSITIGKRKSNLEIAYAFSNMTNKYLNYVDFKYNNVYVDNKNHSWCFVVEHPKLEGSYQYNCCYSYYDFVKKEINVNCSDDWLHDDSTSYGSFGVLLLILSYILLCYFPIPLLNIVSNMSRKKIEENVEFRQVRNYHMSLNDRLTSDILYLEKHSPITFSSIIYEFMYKSCIKRHPQLASRLLRFLFIILFPILLYIQLILYCSTMKETTLELIKHGVGMGFLSMLGEFERSRGLMIPVLGRPVIVISVFFFVGIVFVVLPDTNMGDLLEEIVLDVGDKSTLVLGYDSVQLYSHMQIKEECVYGRLRSLLIARFLCVLNPKFWCRVCCMSFARLKKRLTCLRNIRPVPLNYFLLFILAPIRFLFFLAVLSHCFIYFALPFYFVFISFHGVIKFWMECLSERSEPLLEKLFTAKIAYYIAIIVRVFLFLLVSFLYWYFSFCLTMIFCYSVFFVSDVIVFLFIAVLVYPSTAFVYLSLGFTLFYYLFKQLRGIGDVYLHLLSDIVKSLNVLEAESNELRVVISYKDRVPGIPRELFLYVVQKHRPVFISIFKAILPLVIVSMLIPGTIKMTSFVSNDSSLIAEIMKVIFIVLIGSLPRAVEIAFSDLNNPALKEIFLKRLEATILEYNKLLVETQSPDDPGLASVMSV